MNPPNPQRFRYKLTLEVSEFGEERSFVAAVPADSQSAIARNLAYDIGRMFAVLNDPPPPDAVVLAMDESRDDPLTVLAYLRDKWTGSRLLSECVRIVVDFDGLLEGEPPDAVEAVRQVATSHAFVEAVTDHGEKP